MIKPAIVGKAVGLVVLLLASVRSTLGQPLPVPDGTSCPPVAAKFMRMGAFADKVWAIVDHANTAQFEVRGFRSVDSWPLSGTVLREVAPKSDGRHLYVVG